MNYLISFGAHRHLLHLRMPPCAPLQPLPSPEATTILLFIIMLILPILEFHVNGIIAECIFFLN